MNRYFYDLHIHSCLSPCGDDSSTPDSIAGMGELNGLNIMALTDHNTCKNCPAFFKAARRHGIVPIAGMELTTAEDIHVICLFDRLERAMEFDSAVSERRIFVKNRPDIFGNQLILDDCDNPIGEEEFLLSNATEITLDEAPALAEKFGGICYPAHVDRSANGVIAVLGTFPESPEFSCAEVHNADEAEKYSKLCGRAGKKIIISSDAHYLWDIKEKCEYFELDDEPYSSALVAENLIKYLRSAV